MGGIGARPGQMKFHLIKDQVPWLQLNNSKQLPFQLGPYKRTPAKKGGEKKNGRFAINEMVTRESTIDIHKCIHAVGFKKCAPWARTDVQKFAMKEMGTPDVCTDTRLRKAVWANGIKNVLYRFHMRLSRKT
nr:60S ribosomal protein L31-like [Oryctolagus cuniculus]